MEHGDSPRIKSAPVFSPFCWPPRCRNGTDKFSPQTWTEASTFHLSHASRTATVNRSEQDEKDIGSRAKPFNRQGDLRKTSSTEPYELGRDISDSEREEGKEQLKIHY